MNDKDCRDITDALLKVMCKADEEFQEQLARGIGITLEEFQEYLDKVDFSGVKMLSE